MNEQKPLIDQLHECQDRLMEVDKKRIELKIENEELRDLFVYFFGENYEELAKGEQDA